MKELKFESVNLEGREIKAEEIKLLLSLPECHTIIPHVVRSEDDGTECRIICPSQYRKAS